MNENVPQGTIALVAMDLGFPTPEEPPAPPSIGRAAIAGGPTPDVKGYKSALLQARNDHKRLFSALLEKSEREGLVGKEKRVLDALDDRIAYINAELDSLPKFGASTVGNRGGRSRAAATDLGINALTPDQSFATAVGSMGPRHGAFGLTGAPEPTPEPGEPGSLGAIVKGQLGLQAAQGIGSTGINMVPTPLSAKLIDLARNQARVIQAGALTVPMEASTLKFAKWTGDPTGHWRAEHAAITESDATLDSVTLTAKSLAALCRVSIELMEDAKGFEVALESALAQALALELDRAALYGSGAGEEPLGVAVAAGTNEVLHNAILERYAPLSKAVEACWQANAEPGDFILAPRTRGQLDRLLDGNLAPLQPPRSVAERQLLTTNQVPTNLGTGSDESEIITGQWSDMIIGMRTNIVIEASRVAGADTFSKMQVLVRAYLRADVQLARPDHFAIVRGILPDLVA